MTMKKRIFIFLTLTILIGIFLVNSQENIVKDQNFSPENFGFPEYSQGVKRGNINVLDYSNKTSTEIIGLNDNNTLRVVINIKEPAKEEGFIFKRMKSNEEIEHEKNEIKNEIISQVGQGDVKHIFDNQLAVEITNKEINLLKSNPNIDSIFLDRKIIAFLQDSVSLVNATRTWPLQFLGLNLTGLGETICIIDTGVNFSHPDLIGKNLTCNIDCVGKACVENCSINDDNGHGTHVSGIAGANGLLKGVAIGAKIIGVKVLDSTGSGAGSDLDAGIDWCIANANAYNISVISMSLGTACRYSNGSETGWCYNYYCDNVATEQSTAVRIDNATSRNISIIVATGNNANFTHISSPACIKNATAIGATDKSDNIATSYSNRNNLTDLFAAGSSINSTMIPSPGGTVLLSCGTGKSYCVLSGTSMATPHVAGAFAILRQFFRAQNSRVPTPTEVQDTFNSTGKIIFDSQSGLNFSRINIYSAVLALDTTPPNVTLIFPINNSVNTTLNQTFSCTASDFQLSNITFYIWNSTNSLIYNETKNISGISNSTVFNVTNLNYGTYTWNCKSFDLKNFSAFANTNFSITINYLNINLSFPQDNLITNQNQSYNCTFTSESAKSLKNTTLFIWNSSNSLIYNETKNISGISNSTQFSFNLTQEGNYTWNCRIFNNNSESAFANSNFSIKYDLTIPILSLLSSSVTSSTASISWNSDEITNSSLLYGTNASNLNLNNAYSNFSLNHSFSLTGLTSSTAYYYNITLCDNAGNCIINGTNNFTTSDPPSTESTSSSGGGGGAAISSSNSYNVMSEEIISGYTQDLNKNDKIIFSLSQNNIQTSGGIGHTLTINEIKENYVNITIRSFPVTLILFIGESKKLNLSSPNFYDLYIKLENIINKKAKITIKKINESIIKNNMINVSKEIPIERPVNAYEGNNEIEEGTQNLEINTQKIVIIIFICIVLILIVILIILFMKYKVNIKISKKQKTIKEYKEVFNRHINIKSKKIKRNIRVKI